MGSVRSSNERKLEIKKGISRGRKATSKVVEIVMTGKIHFNSVFRNARNILGNIVIKVSVRFKEASKFKKEVG